MLMIVQRFDDVTVKMAMLIDGDDSTIVAVAFSLVMVAQDQRLERLHAQAEADNRGQHQRQQQQHNIEDEWYRKWVQARDAGVELLKTAQAQRDNAAGLLVMSSALLAYYWAATMENVSSGAPKPLKT